MKPLSEKRFIVNGIEDVIFTGDVKEAVERLKKSFNRENNLKKYPNIVNELNKRIDEIFGSFE